MPFSSGTFTRTFDCTTDRDNGVKILASKFDTEFDGIATGLSTCILKDGTQTCTAAIPFAEGLTIPDNKTIVLGTNSDITIQYDETTNDSLEIAANVEGAGLGIVLKADQGDDNADQHKLNIADGGVLTLQSKISGGFVTYLTHTPNATVADGTTAVAGNLTVAGDLTLGSGAVINEAELDAINGVTAGTVAASKAVIVDSNKDIASFRNVTLTGELDAGSLDISGDADIDGTLEADAMTLNGTAITATATLDTGISNNNVPKFTSGVADNDFLRVDGTAIEGRSASEVLSDIGAAPAAGDSNIVTTGALNSGSITSGFGAIDNGSSNITTTGVGTFGSLDISGDLTVDTNTLKVDSTNNRMAIGTTSTSAAQVTIQGSGSPRQLLITDDGAEKLQIFQIGNDATIEAGSGGSETTNLIFKTASSGTESEAMRIDGSGNVGIGNNSPGVKLEANGDIKSNVADGSNAQISAITAGSSNYATLTTTNGSRSYSMQVRPDQSNAFAIRDETGGANRFLINTSGHVGIGISPTQALHVDEPTSNNQACIINSSLSSFQGQVLKLTSVRTTTNSSFNFFLCGADKLAIRDSGNVVNANNSYGQFSDQRLKENIKDASSQWDDIKALQVRNFNFIDDDLTQIGVVAQEVETAGMSGLVEEARMSEPDKDGNDVVRKNVKYSVLYMKAVKALQEAMTRIETLETKVAALEAGS